MVPKEGRTLLLYIAATNRVVSTTIVIEREEVGHVYKVQCVTLQVLVTS
jgi:hypothetical protein